MSSDSGIGLESPESSADVDSQGFNEDKKQPDASGVLSGKPEQSRADAKDTVSGVPPVTPGVKRKPGRPKTERIKDEEVHG